MTRIQRSQETLVRLPLHRTGRSVGVSHVKWGAVWNRGLVSYSYKHKPPRSSNQVQTQAFDLDRDYPGNNEEWYGGGRDGGGRSMHDEELHSEIVRIESKQFYLDLKENNNGRYMKISEKAPTRRRVTVVVPSTAIPWVFKLFKFYCNSNATSEYGSPGIDKELRCEKKTFSFEVGENAGGRYLKLTERGGPGWNSIFVPSGYLGDGWRQFRDAVMSIYQAEADLGGLPSPLDETSEDDSMSNTSRLAPSPEGPLYSTPSPTPIEGGVQVITVGKKRFYFDPGSDLTGQYVRVTEDVGSQCNTVVIPVEAVEQFQNALQQCVATLQDQDQSSDIPQI